MFRRHFTLNFNLILQDYWALNQISKSKVTLKKKHRVFSTYHAGVHRELPTIFVYCDIIQHQLIAETSAPLLRILNWNHTERTQNISQTFSELFYVPLKAYDFDTIHIYLLDSMGYPISFENGNTFAVLEFREKTVNGTRM